MKNQSWCQNVTESKHLLCHLAPDSIMWPTDLMFWWLSIDFSSSLEPIQEKLKLGIIYFDYLKIFVSTSQMMNHERT